ncbi:MAG: NAD(P)-dependent oxidoreductase [Francisellaceae bacterium]
MLNFNKTALTHHLTSTHYGLSAEPTLLDQLYLSLDQQDKLRLRQTFDHTYLIGVQHLMNSEICLFETMIQFGIKPQNMRFCGKLYSDYPPAIAAMKSLGMHIHTLHHDFLSGYFNQHIKMSIRNMWKQAVNDLEHNEKIKNIILLDEGGRALEEAPKFLLQQYNFICIEHTRGGLYSKSSQHFNGSLINAATCPLKTRLESPKIIHSVTNNLFNRLENIGNYRQRVYGIVGVGNLGKALFREFKKLGLRVYIYDQSPERLHDFLNTDHGFAADSFEKLIYNVDTLISTTGTDISKYFDFRELTHDLTMISISSEDKEFNQLLRNIQHDAAALKDIDYITSSGNKLSILSGGFPVNFNGSAFCVPPKDIIITRALMCGAILQAAFLITENPYFKAPRGMLSINAYLQKFLAGQFLSQQLKSGDYNEEDITFFNNLDAVKLNSSGQHIEIPAFERLISDNMHLTF